LLKFAQLSFARETGNSILVRGTVANAAIVLTNYKRKSILVHNILTNAAISLTKLTASSHVADQLLCSFITG
jgi:hypothetical protein